MLYVMHRTGLDTVSCSWSAFCIAQIYGTSDIPQMRDVSYSGRELVDAVGQIRSPKASQKEAMDLSCKSDHLRWVQLLYADLQ